MDEWLQIDNVTVLPGPTEGFSEHEEIVPSFQDNPSVNLVTEERKWHFVRYNLRAINVLVEKEVLSQVDNAQRGRVFCANAIMKILDEPPKNTQK